jgi:hypothetical protein
VEHLHARFLGLLEEFGDVEVRILGAFHQGDENLHVVFLPEPPEVGLETPLPSTSRLFTRGKGDPEPPWQLKLLRR